MTEAEWYSGTELEPLLAFAVCQHAPPAYVRPLVPLSDRKLRLFLVGCCRSRWEVFTHPTLRQAVEVAELFADGEALESALEFYRQLTYDPSTVAGDSFQSDIWVSGVALLTCQPMSSLLVFSGEPEETWLPNQQPRVAGRISRALPYAVAVRQFGDTTSRPDDCAALRELEEDKYVHLLRCISGNPFRPVAFDPNWRTETVVSLASAIYAERAFDRMPILADALEEAGCDQADILSHCRGMGPHARGCWVVDLVLGKE